MEHKDPDFAPKQTFVSRENVWLNMPLVGLCIALAWAASSFFSNIDRKMDNLQTGINFKIDSMQKDITSMNNDRIRKGILREFARELEHNNPSLKIPDVDAIISRIQ